MNDSVVNTDTRERWQQDDAVLATSFTEGEAQTHTCGPSHEFTHHDAQLD